MTPCFPPDGRPPTITPQVRMLKEEPPTKPKKITTVLAVVPVSIGPTIGRGDEKKVVVFVLKDSRVAISKAGALFAFYVETSGVAKDKSVKEGANAETTEPIDHA